VAALGTLLFARSTLADQVDVAEELQRLADAHGFSVKGLEQTEEVQGRAEGEDLVPRLRRLLEDFNHVIVQAPAKGVERVIILGAKVPYEPPPPPQPEAPEGDEETPEGKAEQPEGEQPDAEAQGGEKAETEESGEDAGSAELAMSTDIILDTTRRGSQHIVGIGLEGRGGNRVQESLLVDTGADRVVLPASLIARLGISPRDLKQREMQTANGKSSARIGTIRALWLGGTRVTNVDVAFIDDAKLGSSGLLGMSVLGRYKLTIDDERSQITLSSK
jgi:clan AA aspartic protease (TIGR02281 family)